MLVFGRYPFMGNWTPRVEGPVPHGKRIAQQPLPRESKPQPAAGGSTLDYRAL